MKCLLFIFCSVLFALASANSYAHIFVVTHKSNEFSALSRNDVTALFLGKKRTLPNGKSALMVDRGSDSKLREDFFYALNRMPLSRLNAYWSRLTFSGRMIPPQEIVQESDVVHVLTENPNALSYVENYPNHPDLKVVLTLKRGNE